MLATVEQIRGIDVHPNADRLVLAKVLNHVAIVPKNTYRTGDKIVFIQPDTVLPDREWAEPFKKFSKNRVKAQKLRGVWSMGIVIGLKDVGLAEDIDIGTDVSDQLGVVKYEPKLPQDNSAKGLLPFNLVKTDEEN